MSGAALFLVVLAAGLASAESKPTLRHNPFVRPDAVPAAPDAGPASRSGAPLLRATLVAGARSIVDLNGKLLAIGEEVDGYRLLEVRAWEAVFEYRGRRVTIEVDPREAP